MYDLNGIKYAPNFGKIFNIMQNVLKGEEFVSDDDVKLCANNQTLAKYRVLDMAAILINAIAEHPAYKKRFLVFDDNEVEDEINVLYMKIILKKFRLLYEPYFEPDKIKNIKINDIIILMYIGYEWGYTYAYDTLKKEFL